MYPTDVFIITTGYYSSYAETLIGPSTLSNFQVSGSLNSCRLFTAFTYYQLIYDLGMIKSNTVRSRVGSSRTSTSSHGLSH